MQFLFNRVILSPRFAGRIQSSSNQCRVNEPSLGAPVAHWRHTVRGPNTWELHLRVRYCKWKRLLVARPQFTGVRTIGGKAHLIFQGFACAVTLSAHKGERDPWGSIMGQSCCQSLSPSPINPYNLNSHWMLWEGQVYGDRFVKVSSGLCTSVNWEIPVPTRAARYWLHVTLEVVSWTRPEYNQINKYASAWQNSYKTMNA